MVRASMVRVRMLDAVLPSMCNCSSPGWISQYAPCERAAGVLCPVLCTASQPRRTPTLGHGRSGWRAYKEDDMQQPPSNGPISRAEYESRQSEISAKIAQLEARYFAEVASM